MNNPTEQWSKTENLIVNLALGVLCPLLLAVLAWWGAAALFIYDILPIPESAIAAATFLGLAAGLALDALFLKRWGARFYHLDMRLLALVYLFCSAIAVAFFMGLPLGNLALGALAGVYVGRRQHHADEGEAASARAIRRASWFTALVTGLEALPIGLLALLESDVAALLGSFTGWSLASIQGATGIGMVVVLSAVLAGLQFGFTWATARLTLKLGEQVR